MWRHGILSISKQLHIWCCMPNKYGWKNYFALRKTIYILSRTVQIVYLSNVYPEWRADVAWIYRKSARWTLIVIGLTSAPRVVAYKEEVGCVGRFFRAQILHSKIPSSYHQILFQNLMDMHAIMLVLIQVTVDQPHMLWLGLLSKLNLIEFRFLHTAAQRFHFLARCPMWTWHYSP